MNQLFVYLRDHLLFGQNADFLNDYRTTMGDFVKSANSAFSAISCFSPELHGMQRHLRVGLRPLAWIGAQRRDLCRTYGAPDVCISCTQRVSAGYTIAPTAL
jgi:hypothetical protein